jgi:hypothetical protein
MFASFFVGKKDEIVRVEQVVLYVFLDLGFEVFGFFFCTVFIVLSKGIETVYKRDDCK